MSITTYAELKTAIANWLARDDLETYIPDFITLFEASLVRKLRIRTNTTSSSITPSSGIATYPSDALSIIRVTWTGSPRVDLEYVHPIYFEQLFPDRQSGTPTRYTVEGTSLKVGPLSDTALDVVYYERSDAVSGTLNSIFTRHPDLYLFGSLVEAEAFNKNAEAAALWKARRDELYHEIQMADFNERGNMVMRVHGYTP
jgi:hypothetical protein